MSRPKGHVRDVVPHPRSVPHHVLLGAAPTQLPDAVTLPAQIVNQLGSNCTNFGYGWLVATWCAVRGLACDELSHRAMYTLGRMIGSGDPSFPLTDDGANPTDVIEGMRIFGVVPESIVGGDGPDVINQRLSFGDLETARTWQVTGIGRIDGTGETRCQAIRQALANGYPVGFGMSVDQSYEELRGPTVYTGLKGPSVGAHAQRIVGFRPGVFQIAGSWSTAWADGGTAWIADSFIGSDQCFDFYFVSSAVPVRA